MKNFVNRLLDSFKDWLSKRLPDCRNVTPTIGESLDRRLGFWERVVMKLHLFTCDRCDRYLKHLGFLKKTVHQHGELIADPEPAPTSDLRDESKEKIKRLLIAAAQGE